jgi:hypothetical protein
MPTKYLSSDPITHLFDQLPTDMIYYEIFPYLDYESRVTANLLLPIKDRMSVLLNKESVLQFSLRFAAAIVKRLMDKQRRMTNPIALSRINLKIWRTLGKFPQLVQYHAEFRQITIDKIREFTDPATYEGCPLSVYTQKELMKLCGDFLERIETSLPFIRSVKSISEDWTPLGPYKCK